MALSLKADLELEIDGQPATLKGPGSTLQLTLSTPCTLRALPTVSLPNVKTVNGRAPSFSEAAGISAAQGLAREVADARGLLLILGRGAAGRSLSLPGLGRLERLTLGGRRAALRLLSSV